MKLVKILLLIKKIWILCKCINKTNKCIFTLDFLKDPFWDHCCSTFVNDMIADSVKLIENSIIMSHLEYCAPLLQILIRVNWICSRNYKSVVHTQYCLAVIRLTANLGLWALIGCHFIRSWTTNYLANVQNQACSVPRVSTRDVSEHF